MNKTGIVKSFFRNDIKVKKLLSDIASPENTNFDEDRVTDFFDSFDRNIQAILQTTREMINELKDIAGIDYLAVEEEFNEFEQRVYRALNELYGKLPDNCRRYNSMEFKSALTSFIQSYCTNMRPEFVQSVRTSMIGFYMAFGNETMEPITMNEYLHYIHSYLVNNHDCYKSIPVIKEGKSQNEIFKNNQIILHGVENDVSNALFDELVMSSNVDSDIIDILSLEDQVIVMARDLGHAAVIEITPTSKSDELFVRYFIPKNTNSEKISKLRGIHYFDEQYATGEFLAKRSVFAPEMVTFMSTIPTDHDIVYDYSRFFGRGDVAPVEEATSEPTSKNLLLKLFGKK